MSVTDTLRRFVFERYPFRGHLVHLGPAWRAMMENHDYPAEVRDTLGEAVAATALLAATLKFEGRLSLQLRGTGPMHLMLVECTDGLGVRAVANSRIFTQGNLQQTSNNLDLAINNFSEAIRLDPKDPVRRDRPKGEQLADVVMIMRLDPKTSSAALLSIHARVEGTGPSALDDPSLVQVWGPRFNVYVVSAADRAAAGESV